MSRFITIIMLVLMVCLAVVPAQAQGRSPMVPSSFNGYGYRMDPLGQIEMGYLEFIRDQVGLMGFNRLDANARFVDHYWRVPTGRGWAPVAYQTGAWTGNVRVLSRGERIVQAAGITASGAVLGGMLDGKRGAGIGAVTGGVVAMVADRMSNRRQPDHDGVVLVDTSVPAYGAQAQIVPPDPQGSSRSMAPPEPHYSSGTTWTVYNPTLLRAEVEVGGQVRSLAPYQSIRVSEPDEEGGIKAHFLVPASGGVIRRVEAKVQGRKSGDGWDLIPPSN